MMMESDKENLHSPSFNTYSSSSSSSFSCNINSSSHTLAQIAARVVQEFHHFYDDDDLFPHQTHKQQQPQSNNCNQNKDDDDNHNYDQKEDEEFEFAILAQPPLHSSPIPADQIFYNGQIRPLYPLFNTNLLHSDATHHHNLNLNLNHNDDDDPAPVKAPVIRLPLGKLFLEETESCSSSEVDEDLQGVPAETYCVWRPKAPEKCKKSNSTGNSWKFRDLIYSEGKDTFVFLASKKSNSSGIRKEGATTKGKGVGDEEAVKGSGRRWYLGQKNDTAPGLFSGVSRSIHPF